MTRTFPRTLTFIGIPIVAAACLLAGHLVMEQTLWSWSRGPQMVGFSLMHSGFGVLLILALYAGVLWAGAVLIAAAVTKSLGGKLLVGLLLAYGIAWGTIAIPYGFWQRLFIEKYSPELAADFFTYAAATGDLETVKAFLERGVDINTQGDNGTALHGSAVEGELEVIEFLLAHGADVNAINPFGDTPLASALNARERAPETQALLAKYGGKVLRGSPEHRDRVIEEQVRRNMQKYEQTKNK